MMMSVMATSDRRERRDEREPNGVREVDWLELVRAQVGSLRFGTVLITVHEERVVQVEKNEKVRLG
jgi:hypothetical protein